MLPVYSLTHVMNKNDKGYLFAQTKSISTPLSTFFQLMTDVYSLNTFTRNGSNNYHAIQATFNLLISIRMCVVEKHINGINLFVFILKHCFQILMDFRSDAKS